MLPSNLFTEGAGYQKRRATSGEICAKTNPFLCYINDLPGLLSCIVSLYSADTLLYQTSRMQKWFEMTSMLSISSLENGRWRSTKNCPTINFERRMPAIHYKLGTSCLGWVKQSNYLGVIIQSDLRFDQHINDKCIKFQKLLNPWCMMPQKGPSYWFTQVYVDPYPNMRMWCGTLCLKIRFLTKRWSKSNLKTHCMHLR